MAAAKRAVGVVPRVEAPRGTPGVHGVHDHQAARVALGVGEGDGHRLRVRHDVLHAEHDRAASAGT